MVVVSDDKLGGALHARESGIPSDACEERVHGVAERRSFLKNRHKLPRCSLPGGTKFVVELCNGEGYIVVQEMRSRYFQI